MYVEERDRLMAGGVQGRSYWLRAAVLELDRRDPLDALDDAEALVRLCSIRVAEVLAPVTVTLNGGRP